MIPFDQWAKMRGRHRALFWASQGFPNLKRATMVHWVMSAELGKCL
jgi:hypothetical protein